MLRRALALSIAACAMTAAVPCGAQTEISCGFFGCKVTGPLDAEAVAKIKEETNWNAKPLSFHEDATDADLRTVVLLKDELLGLSLSNCKKITDISPLAEMTRLETLKLDRAEGITDFTPVGKIKTLKVLDLSHLKFQSIDFLKELRDLEEIAFFQPGDAVTDISALAGHTKLKKANFYAFQFQDLGPLKDATEMTELSLYSTKVNDLSPLAGMKGLRDLNLYACPLTDLSPLAELTELTKLDLYFLDEVQDFSPLARLTKLEDLVLTFTKFKDLSLLTSMPELAKLQLWKCPIEDWAPLAKLTKLNELNVSDTSFSDASLLAQAHGLKSFAFEQCPRLTDVGPLKSLPELESMRLRETPVDVANAELFKGFPKLKYVALSKKQVSPEQVDKLMEAAPGLKISAY
jgi:hypothetical protein